MKQSNFIIIKNEKLISSIYEMVLEGDTSEFRKPGQFVNIKLDGFYLRRPISVCEIEGNLLTLVYKSVGKGTEYLATLQPGTILDLLTGLGNGFDTSKSGNRPLIIGGGVGIPPMYGLAKTLTAEGKKPVVVLGFNETKTIFYGDKFKQLGCEVIITTVDGGEGIRGYVTDALTEAGDFDYYYACGPEPMLKAIYNKIAADGQLSFEERMACGFGVCMCCSCKTLYGNKRICRDGPVLEKNEIIWEV